MMREALINIEELTSFWFWLSFWSDAIAVISVASILRLAKVEPDDDVKNNLPLWERMQLLKIHGKPWYYVLAMIVVAAIKALSCLQAFFYDINYIDPMSALEDFTVGAMLACVYVYYRYGAGRIWSPEQIHRLTYRLLFALLLTVITALSLALRLALRRSNDLHERAVTAQEKEVKAAEKQADTDSTAQAKKESSTSYTK